MKRIFSEKWIVMIKEYDDKGNYRCIPRKRKNSVEKAIGMKRR